MSKILLEDRDIVQESNVTLTSGIWSEGATSLTAYHTSSTQSGSNGTYFLHISEGSQKPSAALRILLIFSVVLPS